MIYKSEQALQIMNILTQVLRIRHIHPLGTRNAQCSTDLCSVVVGAGQTSGSRGGGGGHTSGSRVGSSNEEARREVPKATDRSLGRHGVQG